MSLEKQAASSVIWAGTSSAVTIGLRILQLVVLARLLSPGDFGLMVMITVVIGFAEAFADMGISNAIIHHQHSSRMELSSLYWMNMLAGILVFGLVMASSPLVVRFYNEPRLMNLISWASLIFFITPVGKQFEVLLQKELQFDRLARVEIVSTAIGTVVAVSSAIYGQGVFSLIWGQLAAASWKALSLLRSGWYLWGPTLHFRWSDVKTYFSFGLYQMGERSLNLVSANADYLIIGRFLGPQILGIYMLAYQLVTIPHTRINPILTRIAFPVFARRQTDNAALRRGYLEMIKLLAYIVFPLMLGLAATAPLIVPVVFGAQWEPAVPLIQILAPVGMIKALLNPSGSILLAKGRPDIGFKWNALSVILDGSIFWLVVLHGVRAVAWSYVGLSIVHFIIGWLILHFIIDLNHREYMAVLLLPLAFSVLMGVTVYVSYLFLSGFIVNKHLLLACLLVLGMGVYSLVVLLKRKYFRELWVLVFEKQRAAA
jgi:O-antigen/teichoic acid export membrane protein